MTLSDEIRKYMVKRGVTSYRLSQEIGIDAAQLSRFFKGDGSTGLSIAKLLRVLDYLNLELRIVEKS
ncbi:MAG: helix-turn-helix transcriptional regulator [Synergistaceae bacterium]|nr:helix-turn-helix transcriptional regulator [Synergistaceae bacterium]